MQKITPFLWFDNQAEEATNFYTSIFKNSSIGSITRWGDRPIFKHERYAYLGFMYVHPDYRGKGVNSKIIEGL